MKGTGFQAIRTSIENRQNTVAQNIATRPLLGLCEEIKQIGGARVSRMWWDKKVIVWEKAKARVAGTDSETETDTEEEEARSTDSGGSDLSGAKWSGASVNPWDVTHNSKILHMDRA